MARTSSASGSSGKRSQSATSAGNDLAATNIDPAQWQTLLDCEQRIGYRFEDKSLIFEALTHASSVDRRLNSYERMEFLGDSILGFIVCEFLYKNYVRWDEGELTKVKSIVVSRHACAQMGIQLGLAEFLSVGKGIGALNKVPGSLLANAFEALIAAIYLDGGLEPVRNFLMPIVRQQVDSAMEGELVINYKSELQHYVQKRFGLPPVYLVLGTRGPDHEKQFQIAAKIIKRTFLPAWGRNKKEAEQRAAANALAEIAGKIPPYPETELIP
jgi:ribonuclease-3